MTHAPSPAPPSTKASAGESKSATETLSVFVARILDQLSLSSWLPAIMLVCNFALLAQLHSQRNFDVAAAITALTSKTLGVLVVLVLAIVVSSVITQAFEFEIIRVLEGYWGSIRVFNWLSSVRTRHHALRRRRLEDSYQRQSRAAFLEAREVMLDTRVPRETVDVLEKIHRGESLDGHDEATVRAAEKLGWRRYSPPETLRHLDAVETRIAWYPRPHRILPTRLGNTLRSAEDRLRRGADEELEDFVLRRYEYMSPELRVRHDQFRSRLNIYCMLTVLFFALGLAAPPILIHDRPDIVGAISFTVVYLVLAVVSYQAAIASARGYVSVLRTLSALASTTASTDPSAPSPTGAPGRWARALRTSSAYIRALGRRT